MIAPFWMNPAQQRVYEATVIADWVRKIGEERALSDLKRFYIDGDLDLTDLERQAQLVIEAADDLA